MIIEMSLDQHDRFLALCVPASREYEILKNGLIIRRPKEGTSNASSRERPVAYGHSRTLPQS
jgi:hypothetical protein